MNALTQHIQNILAIDGSSLIVMAVLCGAASYVLKEYLTNPIMVIFVFPILLLFSVLAQYLFIYLELYPTKKLDQWLMWTIMSSILGAIAGIGLVAGISVLRDRPRA